MSFDSCHQQAQRYRFFPVALFRLTIMLMAEKKNRTVLTELCFAGYGLYNVN